MVKYHEFGNILVKLYDRHGVKIDFSQEPTEFNLSGFSKINCNFDVDFSETYQLEMFLELFNEYFHQLESLKSDRLLDSIKSKLTKEELDFITRNYYTE